MRKNRSNEIVGRDEPVSRVVPEGRSTQAQIRQAVDDLRRLREEIAGRKGITPLTDQEIREAVEAGRRC